MLSEPGLEPIDYLLIGHITQDLTNKGPRLGGTVAFAACTARALGLRVGIITSWGQELETPELEGINILNLQTERSTTFENIEIPDGHQQVIHHQAPTLDFYHIPQLWRNTPIVQLAPVAQDINPTIIRYFPNANLFITPQGWLRQWDENGSVYPSSWLEADYLLPFSKAVVISEEDVHEDQNWINALALASPILVVTRGSSGATLYHQGDEHHIPAPLVEAIDTVGAGDVFAAGFFISLMQEGNPVKAVQFANQIAAKSVTRAGLESAPTYEELYEIDLEVI